MDQRILVVDDDAAIRQLLGHLLAEEYSVQLAQEGKMALEMAASYKPDLILLDMWMPVLDGRAFVNAYYDLGVPLQPIIAMSANSHIEALVDGLPIYDYLAKPFHLDALVACVGKYVGPRSPRSAKAAQ